MVANTNVEIPTPPAVREQVARIAASPPFTSSPRLAELLRFIVEETLAGRADTLRESLIGDTVYARNPPYDPRVDSTVRVEARRLRRKLEVYYASLGKNDTVYISLPTGSYVPTIDRVQPEVAQDAIFERGAGATIAVIPLRALTSSVEDSVFADSLTDEILFAVERSDGLRLVSRAVTFSRRDDLAAMERIASELNIDAFMQGTVRRVDDVLRITIEVSSARGYVSYSDRFDAIDDGTPKLQENIATAILARVRFDSSALRARRIKPKPQAVESFGAIYKARRLLDKHEIVDIRQALTIFDEVARSSPDYARGHTGVADCYCELYRLGVISKAIARQRSASSIAAALDIDPASAEAVTSQATMHAWIDKDYESACSGYLEANALNETARTHRLLAMLRAMRGETQDAARALSRARTIEPISMHQDTIEAIIGFFTGAPPPSDITLRRLLRLPSSSEARAYSALSLLRAQRAGDAEPLLDSLAQAATLPPDLAYLSPNTETSEWSRYAAAVHAAAQGDADSALHELAQAHADGACSLIWLAHDPRFASIADTATFAQLCAANG